MAVDYEELLEKAIDAFFSNQYKLASNYFVELKKHKEFSHIAYFGILCVDSVMSGYQEAKDLFKYFLLSDSISQKNLLEYFSNREITHEEFILDDLSYQENETVLDATIIDSTYSDIMLGEIFEKIGDKEKAIDYLAKALRKRPFDVSLHKKVSYLGKKLQNE